VGDLLRVVNTFNAQAAGTGANSKFVNSVLGDNVTGVITVTYNNAAVGIAAAENQIAIAPWIRTGAAGTAVTLQAALTAGTSGTIDWACVSETNASAVANTVPTAALGAAGVRARFAPASCR
jgi:type IV pilus assembly protein PilA